VFHYNVILPYVILINVIFISAIRMSIKIKQVIMMSIILGHVILLSVVLLNAVAPFESIFSLKNDTTTILIKTLFNATLLKSGFTYK
jgi:hypothetical protein